MVETLSLPAGNPLLTLTNRASDIITPTIKLTVILAKPSLWIIELHSSHDNRLTSDLIHKGIMPALDIVEREWRERQRAALKSKTLEGGKGALIIVGKRDQDKFFSNGPAISACTMASPLTCSQDLIFPTPLRIPTSFNVSNHYGILFIYLNFASSDIRSHALPNPHLPK